MARRGWILTLLIWGCWGCDDEPTDPTPIETPEAGLVDGGSVDVGPDAVVMDAAPTSDAVVNDSAPPPDAAPADASPDAALVPACQNGADDDGDGAIDYPADPGCVDLADDDEADPDQPACSNGEDDDGDGATDHPDDPGCASPEDPSEASVCGGHVVRDVSALARVEGTTVGNPAELMACRNNDAPEAVFLFTLRAPVATLHFDTAGSRFDTLLQVTRACGDPDTEVACNDDVSPGEPTSAVDIDGPALGDYWIVVDGFIEGQGEYVLNIRAAVADGEACPGGEGPVGCRIGSVCREGTCAPAACDDRVDNDGDGLEDYPADPGCSSREDDDETSPDPLPQCADGIDNDGNGQIDFPDDGNCDDAADDEEARPPQCRDGIDNDRDGLIDLDDPGCMGDPDFFSEFNIEACRDGEDNDEDGLVDYPADPGCLTTTDPDEADPDEPPACANGVDDDDDGRADYPDDVESCLFAADETEDDPCLRRAPVEITGLAEARGNTAGGLNDFGASCQARTGNDALLLWRVAEGRDLAGMVLNSRGSDFDTVVSVRDRCDAPLEEEIGCDDDSGTFGSSFLEIGPQAAGTDLWILVDGGFANAEGIWRLRLGPLLAEGADCGPPGTWTCAEGLTCREGAEGRRCAVAACANGVDDDEDGVADYPAEPGCEDASDDDEADPEEPPVCANGLDDDEDGAIDFPEDPGCDGAADSFEGPDCRDNRDNDGDGAIDYDRNGDGFRDGTADNGCACVDDPSEERQPQCQDGCDNDRDGLVDLEDPGCGDDPERDNEFNVAQCRDGLDNDGDGNIDFPNDPGCAHRDDPIEENPDPLPECADGVDNDEDGLIDFVPGGGGDDGCAAAADGDERGPCDVEQVAMPAEGVVRGSTRDAANQHEGSCRPGGQAPDATYVADIPHRARVRISSEGSTFDTVVYARSACAPMTVCPAEPPIGPNGEEDAGVPCMPEPTELACNDDAQGRLQGEVEFDWDGGEVFVFLDGFGNASGNYILTVEAVYFRGGRCEPDGPSYARCPEGFECLPDAEADGPTCQEP